MNDCDSYFGTSGEYFSCIVSLESEGDIMYSQVVNICVRLGCDLTSNPDGWNVNEFFEVGDVFNVDCNNVEPTDEYTCMQQ